MIALDLDAFRGVEEGRAVARNLNRFPGLRQPRTAVMSENFGALHHVRVGDTVTIPGRTTPSIALKIIGTVVDYTWQRGTLLVDRAWYSKEFADDQVDLFQVYLRPGVNARDFQKELTGPDPWAGRNAVLRGPARTSCATPSPPRWTGSITSPTPKNLWSDWWHARRGEPRCSSRCCSVGTSWGCCGPSASLGARCWGRCWRRRP